MTAPNYLRAPFPWFGNKRHAAPLVWQALGDVGSYCEPFCGAIGVLLGRPGGPGRIETINDLSGHVCNFWRSVRARPEEVAAAVDYPVIEQDLHARHRWLVGRAQEIRDALDADPEWCDPVAAGWWAWGLSAWIGSGWCDEVPSTKLPSLGDTGKGLHATPIQMPHVSGAGVHAATPHLLTWCRTLAERLRRVRVCRGDFWRVLTHSALCDRLVGGNVGMFLDPPYSAEAARAGGLYGAEEDLGVAHDAAAWAVAAVAEHPTWRVVVAGYEGEHDKTLAGWRVVAWDPEAAKWGSGGYGRKNGNSKRERLWLSPACLPVEVEAGAQGRLF